MHVIRNKLIATSLPSCRQMYFGFRTHPPSSSSSFRTFTTLSDIHTHLLPSIVTPFPIDIHFPHPDTLDTHLHARHFCLSFMPFDDFVTIVRLFPFAASFVVCKRRCSLSPCVWVPYCAPSLHFTPIFIWEATRIPTLQPLVVVSLRLSSTIMRFRCPAGQRKHSSYTPQKAMYPTVIRCNLESFAVAACCTSGKYDFQFADQ
ncbi:hypothetical protein SCHPADRAFT_234755 [Schizopora paradoxa]|uniref:Uncharacterized protein n=1 Tax=Schizopora paradoxa TaxID=27342 RepID=A0A0H2SFV9_9AGAM|nr:hypothetical protein SCHPADRAFT_234755 [Schizopora paradoxa]